MYVLYVLYLYTCYVYVYVYMYVYICNWKDMKRIDVTLQVMPWKVRRRKWWEKWENDVEEAGEGGGWRNKGSEAWGRMQDRRRKMEDGKKRGWKICYWMVGWGRRWETQTQTQFSSVQIDRTRKAHCHTYPVAQTACRAFWARTPFIPNPSRFSRRCSEDRSQISLSLAAFVLEWAYFDRTGL